jgi:prepilin-type N-terminal cleavage/methylation domain-containing protein/prepilin-type processing-associated H-X9-DG protein
MLGKPKSSAVAKPAAAILKMPGLDSQQPHCRRAETQGFTLIELLVVIAIIGVLAALLLPALVKTKSRTTSAFCLNSLKQLQYAWLMYCNDNNDSLPPNISQMIYPNQVNMQGAWVLGNAQVDTNSANIESGVLFKYTRSAALYRCPADRSTVSSFPDLLRTRSYSTHQWYNCEVQSGTSLDDVNDAALNLRKFSRILNPGHSQAWVFIDEHQVSIDDGIFGIPNPWFVSGVEPVGHSSWGAFPADRHSEGANLSFVDGHVEHHHWRYHRTITVHTNGKTPTVNAEDFADVRWLQAGLPHTP